MVSQNGLRGDAEVGPGSFARIAANGEVGNHQHSAAHIVYREGELARIVIEDAQRRDLLRQPRCDGLVVVRAYAQKYDQAVPDLADNDSFDFNLRVVATLDHRFHSATRKGTIYRRNDPRYGSYPM